MYENGITQTKEENMQSKLHRSYKIVVQIMFLKLVSHKYRRSNPPHRLLPKKIAPEKMSKGV